MNYIQTKIILLLGSICNICACYRKTMYFHNDSVFYVNMNIMGTTTTFLLCDLGQLEHLGHFREK